MPTVFIPKSKAGLSGNGNDQGNNNSSRNSRQTNVEIPRPTVYIPKEMAEQEKAKEQESLAAKRAAGKPVLIFDTKTGAVDLEEGTYSKVPLTAEINSSTDRVRLKQIMKDTKFSDQKTFRQAQQRLHDLDLYGAPGEEVSWNNALPYFINKGVEGVEDFFRNFYNQGAYRYQQRQDDMTKVANQIGGEQFIGKLQANKNEGMQKQEKVNELFDLAPRDQRTAKGAWAVGGEVAHSIGNMAPTIAANVFAPGSGLPLMGIGAMGGATHNAMQDGASLENAITYGMASGAVEIATEKMFGGIPGLNKEGFLGKGVEKAVDELIDKTLKSEVGKAIASKLINVFGEGVEEAVSEIVGEFLVDIYTDAKKGQTLEERLKSVAPDALQAAFLGALTSGVMNVGEMGVQAVTGQNPLAYKPTWNEGLEGDLSSENHLTGENLSGKPTVEIPMEIVAKNQTAVQPQENAGLNAGNLNSDIDDAISAIENANAARVQSNEQLIANDINGVQLQTIENDRPQSETIEDNGIQQIEPEKISQTTQFKIDSLKSKNTAIRFQAQQLNKKTILESAKKIGGFQQAEVEAIAEISNATGVPVQLVESLEYGANGMYKDGTIFIAKGSKNPAKRVLVHEMTHHIESSGMYDQFSASVQAIAEENHWDLAKMKENIISQYSKASEGKVQLNEADAVKELNARIAEEYLFKDEESIQSLATKDRNLAQKILDWIRETLSKLFGNQSSEVKSYTDQLRECEKLYRRAIESTKIDAATKAEYSLDPINEKNVDMYSQEELSELEKNKKILVLGKDIEFDEYIENSLTGRYNNDQRYLYIGKVKESLASKIKQLYNYDISGFSITMNSSEILHSMNQHGYNLKKEISKGNNRTLSKDDFKYMTEIINNFDYSDFDIDEKSGNHALTLYKKIGEDNLACVELISRKKFKLTLKTMYVPKYIKKRIPTPNANASTDAKARTSKTIEGSGFKNSITYDSTNGNKKMSIGENSDIIAKTEIKPEDLSKNVVSYNRYKSNLKSKLVKDYSTETESSNVDNLIDKAAIEVLKDSRVSEETRDRMFNEIWSNSYVPDSEMNADYQQLVSELKSSKIKINKKALASEIPDHKEIVASLKNIVRFSEKEGINIDQRYQELKAFYPQLEDVSNPGDQVKAIAALVKSLKPETHHISDAYGYTKEDMRADLADLLQDFESEIIYRSDKSYYDKVAKKQLASDLAKGKPTSKAYEDATKEVLSEVEAGDQITEQFDAKGLAGLIKNFGSPNKTIQQNLDIAANGNKEVRRKLYDVFEKPMEIAKEGFVKWKQYNVNKLYTKVVKELGIKKGSKESAAVQWYGEGQRQIKVGSEKVGKGIFAKEQDIYRIEPYSLSDLQKDFPSKWQDIVKADKVFREMYDEYVGRMNTTLEKVYTEESLKQQVKDKQNELMAKINYQKSMLKALNEKVVQLKENNAKPEDIASAIAKVSKAKAMIRTSENQFSKISDNVYRNKRLKPRQDYYRHFQELSMADSLLDIFNAQNDQGVSNQLAGISEFTKPKSRWASFMQRRDGNSHYTEDAVAGMLNYIPIAEHKIAFDPVVAKYRGDIQQLIKASDDLGVENTRFINWLSNYTNDLAGKTNYIDRVLANTNNGRKTLKLMKKINGKVKGNAVMGNLNSAVSQFYNLPNALGILTDRGGVKASTDIAKGMKNYTNYVTQKLSNKYFNQQTEFELSPINQSTFLQERFMDDIFSKFDEGMLHKLKDFSAWTLQFGDQVVAESMWFAGYEQGLRLNVDNPVTYADDIVRRAVAGRGVGEIPLTQKSEIVKLVAPFQVEVNNAWQMMKQMGLDKKFVPLLAIFITTWFMNNLNEKLTGNRVGMDLIDAMDDVINNGANLVGRIGGEIASNAPFGAQTIAFLGLPDKDSEKFFGEADPTRYGVGNVGLSALSKPLVKGLTGQDVDWQNFVGNFVTPFGGKQLERTYKFLEDAKVVPDYNLNFSGKPSEWFKPMERGSTGSYDGSGKLKYPIDTKDPFNFAAGMLFGSGATKEGRAFAKEDYRILSEKQTGLYHQMVEIGIPQMDAYKSFFEKKYSSNIGGIEGSKAIMNREIYEKYGTMDAIKKIIESDDNPNGEDAKERDGEITASTFGLNKGVLEMTEEEYQAELKKIRKMIEEMGLKEGK
ncbi:hypothetical protein [Holdemania massiliensis]|uniref:PBECR3 domain-containing polyvalent protein n=1 Tax=Holdemania massiliensis TaxID=1468449 RepID=UPI0026773635|nr:hypothetical protein [Holdemania massiliensis]